MTIILNQADTLKLIASIDKRGKKLDSDIHQAALSSIAHHAAHGDVTLVNRLIVALPKAARRNALMAWVEHFGAGLAPNVEKETRAEAPFVHVKGSKKVFDEAAADAKPFWEFKPEPEYVQFDLAKALAMLLKKAESALAAEQQDGTLISPEKLAALRAIAGTPEAHTEEAQAAATPESVE